MPTRCEWDDDQPYRAPLSPAPEPEPDPHVYVYATIHDRYGNPPVTEYAGSIPAWAWNDRDYQRLWKRGKRADLLADRTSDPRGWRVTFALGEP